MDWLMFVIIFLCNVLTVVICRYAYQINNQYKKGMILGVHIPAWAVHREDVQALCTKSSRIWSRYHGWNLVLGTAVCLLAVVSTEIAVIVWMVWLTLYIVGCWLLLVRIYRKMYRLKTENNWYDEQTRRIRILDGANEKQEKMEFVDDDVYWLNGWYSNPNDKRTLVESKFCSINMEFNMAKPGVRVLVGALLAVTIGIIIWCIYVMVPLVHIEMSLEMNGEQIQIEGGGYEIKFDFDEVENVELLDSMPDESFRRRNGGNSAKYQVGHFTGTESEKTMLFIFPEYTPVLKIQLEEETVYINSKEENQTEEWYDVMKSCLE